MRLTLCLLTQCQQNGPEGILTTLSLHAQELLLGYAGLSLAGMRRMARAGGRVITPAAARARASAAVAARLAKLRELRKLPAPEDDALGAEAEAAAGKADISEGLSREDRATAPAEEGVGSTELEGSGPQAVEDHRHEEDLSPLERLRWRCGLWWHVGQHTSQVGGLLEQAGCAGCCCTLSYAPSKSELVTANQRCDSYSLSVSCAGIARMVMQVPWSRCMHCRSVKGAAGIGAWA